MQACDCQETELVVNKAQTHVIGAGLAGLAAALRLAGADHVGPRRHVVLHEAAAQAGGRCRSFFDAQLGCTIDNGNHILLTANRAALAYLDDIGSRDSLIAPTTARFPFIDLASGETWVVRPNAGPLPWWLLAARRRVPGTGLGDYLAAWRLWRASPTQRVGDCLDPASPLWSRFWEPLCVAALNTRPEEASARLLARVLGESFVRGEAACRTLVARDSLAASFVDPALARLAQRGGEIRFKKRLRHIVFGAERVEALDFGDESLPIGADDRVICALPPTAAAALIPQLTAPGDSRPIVNAHLRLSAEQRARARLPGPFVGLIGGTADWIFLRGDVASLTVSAAEDLIELDNDRLAERLWHDAARALDLGIGAPPPLRLIKEKRATFAQTPAMLARRAPARTAWRNLFLAGDWTDTGYPATIESAVRSGNRAADLVLAAGSR